MSPTTAQQGADHGAAFPGLRMPNEQPVLFFKGTGTNVVLDEDAVDLQQAVVHKPCQCLPTFQRAINGLAEQTLRQGAFAAPTPSPAAAVPE